MVRALVVRMVALAIAFLLVDALMTKMVVSGGFFGAVGLAVVYGLVAAIIGTVVRLITLPLRLLTFGLFDLVINGGLLLVTAWLTDWLSIDGFVAAMIAAFILGLLAAIIGSVVSVVVPGSRRH